MFNDQISKERFLDEYWQKKPALIRQAVDPSAFQLSPDELAGLACEDAVESRLIQIEDGNEWSLRHGPFTEVDFDLPDFGWTLLVQDADKHVAEVAAFLDAFDFLPDWRIDDIMISYATDAGGVGPHTDNYDVFLIQALGQRRWRLSERHYTEADLLTDCDLRVLRNFRTDQDHVLEPGDALYLPPGLAHWGTAIGDCMTWSVGMRGPSDTELLSAWLDTLPMHQGRPHLQDGCSSKTTNPTFIGSPDIERFQTLMNRALPGDTPEFRQWLGCYLTEPKPGFEIEPEPERAEQAMRSWLQSEFDLLRHPWARFALMQTDTNQLTLFSQGKAISYPQEMQAILKKISRSRRLAASTFVDEDPAKLGTVMRDLLQLGWLIADE